jgi:hypothetical protein
MSKLAPDTAKLKGAPQSRQESQAREEGEPHQQGRDNAQDRPTQQEGGSYRDDEPRAKCATRLGVVSLASDDQFISATGWSLFIYTTKRAGR